MAQAGVVDLLEHPVYGLAQVDRILALKPGTARRWIDGYERGGKVYPPVVRVQPTGSDIVTWGEFVETRLLSEYRDQGVPLVRMRPAIDRLRELFDTLYPLALARPFAAGKELVLQVQESVDLERELRLVVVRNDQLVLTPPVEKFVRSAELDSTERFVRRLHPITEIEDVWIDPLRQFGEPVVRSVPTEVIAEQMRAGEPVDAIAELYELERSQVESALRYELIRGGQAVAA